jgi:DNA-binding CsgD family transcriptional regulator
VNEQQLLASLTAKQREVMDLLIEHKTSKEIARILNISPHTVDQRMQFAKDKLGAASRNEAAVIYRRLVEIYGQSTYEDSGIAEPDPEPHDGPVPQGSAFETVQGTRTQSTPPADAELDYAVVQELFDGRHATLIRLSAIVAIAVLLVIVVVGGLAIISQLSLLMAG